MIQKLFKKFGYVPLIMIARSEALYKEECILANNLLEQNIELGKDNQALKLRVEKLEDHKKALNAQIKKLKGKKK